MTADQAAALASDLPALCALRGCLERLDPAGPPGAELLGSDSWPSVRCLGALAGSFNPVTTAHLTLAAAARATAPIDFFVYALSSRTVDKEQPTGMALEDRLILLRALTQAMPATGVVALNRGLYSDQAELLRRELPSLATLAFIVGYDKLVQIFNARYYADRAAALDRLFACASLLVAPRANGTSAEIDALLDRPENRRYRQNVQIIPVPVEITTESSTLVRDLVAASQPCDAHVPPIVAAFVAQTGVYAPPIHIGAEIVDRYALRQQVIRALCTIPSATPTQFQALLSLSLTDTPTGRRLRHALEQGSPAAIQALLDEFI